MVKFQKFINWIKFQLLNDPDVDFKTVKKFVDKFIESLSDIEYEKYKTDIRMIESITSKQITIDSFVKNITINKLEEEFEVLNGKD